MALVQNLAEYRVAAVHSVPGASHVANPTAVATPGTLSSALPARLPRAVAHVVRSLIGAETRLLELDCDAGALYSALLGGRVARYTGLETSPRMVVAARLRGIDAHLYQPGQPLPCAAGGCDVVLALRATLPKLAAVLPETYRALRVGGAFVFSLPATPEPHLRVAGLLAGADFTLATLASFGVGVVVPLAAGTLVEGIAHMPARGRLLAVALRAGPGTPSRSALRSA